MICSEPGVQEAETILKKQITARTFFLLLLFIVLGVYNLPGNTAAFTL